jgi:hypothetical protein
VTNEKPSPAALAGAHRAVNIKAVRAVDGANPIADPLTFQVAVIAHRYRLSPCMARVVCHLAQIGGRLA